MSFHEQLRQRYSRFNQSQLSLTEKLYQELNNLEQYLRTALGMDKCYKKVITDTEPTEAYLRVHNSEKVHLVRVYYSLHYPLLADHFGMKNATLIFEGQKDLMPYLNKLSQKEKSKVTAKTEKDCKYCGVR